MLATGLGLVLTTMVGGTAEAADDPPPVIAPGLPTATAEAPRPPGTVRLNVRPHKATKADVRLHVGDAEGRYAFVCKAPCTADVVPGTALRITVGGTEEGHELVMAGNPGNDVDVEVRPASKGPLAGGIVMTSIGGIVTLIGGIILAIAATRDNDDGLATGGWITFAAGAGLTLGGVLMIARRSREPRVREDEHAPAGASRPIAALGEPRVPALPTRGADLWTRGESDAATRGAMPFARSAFTPLSFSVHF